MGIDRFEFSWIIPKAVSFTYNKSDKSAKGAQAPAKPAPGKALNLFHPSPIQPKSKASQSQSYQGFALVCACLAFTGVKYSSVCREIRE